MLNRPNCETRGEAMYESIYYGEILLPAETFCEIAKKYCETPLWCDTRWRGWLESVKLHL